MHGEERQPPEELAPGTAVGRYTVVRLVGRGGTGAIYAARDERLGRLVAVKVLRPGAGGSSSPESRARLQREAEAMARLSHPNVVPVFDVGESDAGPFLAMEYVDGTTLRGWQEERPRTWREIVAAYAEAGKGLVAAHAAGLVHRDFKPENVLVDGRGVMRVTDFGLARGDSRAEPPAPAGAFAPGATLTATGTFLGTPAYMSPEQIHGRPVDARTDQFAFCVALWEALHGERPFPGATFEALAFSISLGLLREPKRGAQVPERIRRVLRRGLAGVPDERWPGMKELLAELERDPRRTALRLAKAAGALLLVATLSAGWAFWSGRSARLCRGGAERLSDTWNPGARARVEQALASVGTAWAATVARSAVEALDAYAGGWVAGWTDACRATRVRGDQSERLLDLRMACLQRRQWELQAVVVDLAAADRALAERALQVASGLPSLESCSDGPALAQLVEPDDPRHRDELQAARRRMAEARAHALSGRYPEARGQAEQVAAEARRLGNDALLAEALSVHSDASGDLGEVQLALTSVREAARAADRARDDATRAQALASSAWYLVRLGRAKEAMEAVEEAEAVLPRLARLGDAARALVAEARAQVLRSSGRYQESEKALRTALALREGLGQPTKTAVVLLNLEGVVAELGNLPEALALLERARAIFLERLGPEHPDTARCDNNTGAVLIEMGRYRDALAPLSRALAVKERTLGAESPDLAATALNLGQVHLALGDTAQALPLLRRAVALDARSGETVESYYALQALAAGQFEAGDRSGARATLERAIALVRRLGGPDHPFLGDGLHFLAELDLAAGQPARALQRAREASAVDERGQAPAPQRARDRVAEAEALLALGRAREALPAVDAALALLGAVDPGPVRRAEARFARARALRALGRNGEALAEGRDARQLLEGVEGKDQELRQRVDAWLAGAR